MNLNFLYSVPVLKLLQFSRVYCSILPLLVELEIETSEAICKWFIPCVNTVDTLS